MYYYCIKLYALLLFWCTPLTLIGLLVYSGILTFQHPIAASLVIAWLLLVLLTCITLPCCTSLSLGYVVCTGTGLSIIAYGIVSYQLIVVAADNDNSKTMLLPVYMSLPILCLVCGTCAICTRTFSESIYQIYKLPVGITLEEVYSSHLEQA